MPSMQQCAHSVWYHRAGQKQALWLRLSSSLNGLYMRMYRTRDLVFKVRQSAQTPSTAGMAQKTVTAPPAQTASSARRSARSTAGAASGPAANTGARAARMHSASAAARAARAATCTGAGCELHARREARHILMPACAKMRHCRNGSPHLQKCQVTGPL